MKKWLEKFLKKIEEANKKSFGTGRMDCCELNKPSGNKNKGTGNK